MSVVTTVEGTMNDGLPITNDQNVGDCLYSSFVIRHSSFPVGCLPVFSVGETRSAKKHRAGRLLLATLVLFLACGCTANSPVQGKEHPSSLDLASRFFAPGARLKGSGPGSFDPHYPVVRKGQRRDTVLLIAPATAKAGVSGIGGSYSLEALCSQVFNTGDGIQMDIHLTERGERRKVYSRYFDAGRRAADRDWVPISVPLVLGKAQDSQIEIEASAGPQGDLTSDWLALSSVRLVPRKEAR
jgi:hypothetical protein